MLTVKVGIAGSEIDLTSLLIYKSLRIDQRADTFISTCFLQLIDETGTLVVQEKDSILVEDGATKYFAGTVANIDVTNMAEGTETLLHTLECQDYNVLVEEVVIDQLEEYGGAKDSEIIDDLFDKYLPEVNSHEPGDAPPGYVQHLHVFTEIEFEAITLREALDRIATEVESTALEGYWYIDYDKYLHYFNVEDNTPAWFLSDTPDYVNSFSYFSAIQKSRQGSSITNRILVVGAELGLFVQDYDSRDFYGKWYEGIVRDNTLFTPDEVIDHGNALLAKWAYPDQSFQVTTRKEGLRAGMNIRFENTLFNTKTRTNKIKNPSFEINVTDSWTFVQGGTGGSAAQDATRYSSGVQSCKITASDAGDAEQRSDHIPLADGETITIQARLYRAASVSSDIEIYDATNSVSRATLSPALTETWEFLTVSWKNDTGGAVNISVRLRNKVGDGSTEIWFDGCMAEIDKGEYPIEYIDGTRPFCTWSGAAHNSTSLRPPVFMISQLEITWPENTVTFALTLGGKVSPTALIRTRLTGDGIRGGQGPVVPGQLPLASVGWSHNLVFSATDFNTIAWSSGTITTAANQTFSIVAGNTGDMTADTVNYIYLDTDTSLTVLQVTEAGPAVGRNIILVCVAAPDADNIKDATFQVFGGKGIGVMIMADNVAANQVVANHVGANTIITSSANIDTGVITNLHFSTAYGDRLVATKIDIGGETLFNAAEGLLLLGPYCSINADEWWSLRQQLGVITGAFHQEAGRWLGTRALVVEKGITNDVWNPSVETNQDGWTVSGTGSIVRVTTQHRYGSYSLRLIAANDAQTYVQARFGDAAIVGTNTYSISFWIRSYGVPAGKDITLYRYWKGGAAGEIGQDTVVGTTTDCQGKWHRYSWTGEPDETDRDVLVFYVRVDVDASTTQGFYLDGVQCEVSDHVTSYCDGSLGHDYSWAGTAHASVSTRVATRVTLDAFSWSTISGQDELTFSIWWQPSLDATDTSWSDSVWLWDARGASDSHRIALRYYAPVDEFYVYINGALRITNGSAQTFKAGDWVHLVVTLDFINDVYKMYVNGVLDGSDTTALTVPALNINWKLGTYYTGTSGWCNGAIAEYAAFGKEFSASEVAALYGLQRPLVDAGAMDTPGIYILDGRFMMASSVSGSRLELNPNYVSIGSGPTYDSGTGVWMGLDGTTAKLFIGNSAGNKILWDGSTLSVTGDITILNPGDILGSTINNDDGWTDDAAASAANAHRILGVTGTWTATDADTITWTSVVLRLGDGSNVNIVNGNTGNMAAKSYLYYNGTTTLQITTNPNVIGGTHTLVAVAQNGVTKANIQVVGGGTYISGDWINTGTLTAALMNVVHLSAITANMGTLTAGTIQTGIAGTNRVVINIADGIRGIDSADIVQFQLDPSDGKAYAGIGSLWLDSDGLTIATGSGDANYIKFEYTTTSDLVARLYGYYAGAGGTAQLVVEAVKQAGDPWSSPVVYLRADDQVAGKTVTITVTSDDGVLISGNDLRVAKGLYVGSTAVDPSDNDIIAEGHIRCGSGQEVQFGDASHYLYRVGINLYYYDGTNAHALY